MSEFRLFPTYICLLETKEIHSLLCIMHLSLAFPGVGPGNFPGDLFLGSNKNLLNPWGMGQKIHTNFPSPRGYDKDKIPLFTKKTDKSVYFAAFFALTETFQYTHFSSCHAPGVAKGFIKAKPSDFLELTLQKHI